ncbi:hypothetical protein SMITH_604 [Smithella sp. ME-1]|uniref:STAS/SEC14 domain-containing protein n=1 Tax=hydrocarbon metagenome TaxID=938273 RepID=A0A0W8FQK8_9ZZZZ|nr:hypothetical protein SMITH_604 [Smithella sp. ME-1]
MDFLIKARLNSKVVIASVDGEWNKATFLLMRKKVFNLLKSINARHVLLDVRRLKGKISTMEFFKIAASGSFEIKMATVYSEKINIDETIKFSRTVALNRGRLIKAFSDVSEAKKWLNFPELEYE